MKNNKIEKKLLFAFKICFPTSDINKEAWEDMSCYFKAVVEGLWEGNDVFLSVLRMSI